MRFYYRIRSVKLQFSDSFFLKFLGPEGLAGFLGLVLGFGINSGLAKISNSFSSNKKGAGISLFSSNSSLLKILVPKFMKQINYRFDEQHFHSHQQDNLLNLPNGHVYL